MMNQTIPIDVHDSVIATADNIALEKQLLELLMIQEDNIRYDQNSVMFPDEGRFPRDQYQKHIDFISAGAHYRQRALFGANRSGKTRTASYEVACHVTHRYPHWWGGKKFTKPGNWWCVGQTNQQLKESMQVDLLGPLHDIGTGMIPKKYIHSVSMKPGVPGTVESIKIKWNMSERDIVTITFKTCDQSDMAFMGDKLQGIWFDEEPDRVSLYTECFTRTQDPDEPGIVICTFTPLKGLSDVVLSFLVNGQFPPNDGHFHPEHPTRYIEKIMWEDLPPHLSEEDKQELLSSYPEHERGARTRGEPGMGEGRVFPYPKDFISVPRFKIPDWWPRAYGLDVGWKHTAAVWIARDPDSNTLYIYDEYYASEKEAPIHAFAIKQRGSWMRGVIDSAAIGSYDADGQNLMRLYQESGLDVIPSKKGNGSVEIDIQRMSQLFASQQLRVFDDLQGYLVEYGLYHRNDKQEIVKKRDHRLDASRYCLKHFDQIADIMYENDPVAYKPSSNGNGNPYTGY